MGYPIDSDDLLRYIDFMEECSQVADLNSPEEDAWWNVACSVQYKWLREKVEKGGWAEQCEPSTRTP